MAGFKVSLFRRDCMRIFRELGYHVEPLGEEYRLDFVACDGDASLAVLCVGGPGDLARISPLGEWEEGLAEVVKDAEVLGLPALIVLPREPGTELLSVTAFCEHYGVDVTVSEWSALPLELVEDPMEVRWQSATELFFEVELGSVPEWPEVGPAERLLVGDRRVTVEDVVRVVKREVSLDWRDLVMRLRWQGYSGEGLAEVLYAVTASEEVEVTDDGEFLHVPERLSEVLGALLVWLQNREKVPEDEVYEFLFAQFGVPYDVTYIALKKLEEEGEIEVRRGVVVARS